jgi:hypothetical protein
MTKGGNTCKRLKVFQYFVKGNASKSNHQPISSVINVMEEKRTKYRNPNLGLATKTRACKRARQERDMGGTSCTLGSEGKCERMNLHTPKATPTWGIGVPKDS